MVSAPNRRQFLKFSAAATAGAALPENLKKALAVPPNKVTGTIQDVEHVVILMQENRSFDHYFGCLQGVRGYGDPRAKTLSNGSSVFAQPDGKGGHVLPFLFNTAHTSSACLASLDHSWKGTQTAWNNWDTWVPHKTPMTMGYFTRAEIPYYYALADAFTICDSYHASIFGPTNPNRLYFFSGTSGLAVGNTGKQVVDNVDDGNWSADITKDHPDFTPFNWTTYPEKLQDAGISWRVYQEYDNFGDNPLASFAAFRNLDRNSWAYRRARTIVPGSGPADMHNTEGRYLIAAFERDVAQGTLPQVSWIVPPTALSEHPNAPPGYGEYLISALMDVFVRHPDVWTKTVFILNYDENDGFFDHVPPPIPALDEKQGISTASTQGESYHGVPVGLGPRVPALIISPWTKGGWVNSQVFDHTSILRFLEARFGVPCPFITPWRRSICGDMTSIFDFSQTDRRWEATLPRTDTYLAETRKSCSLPKPEIPSRQTLPRQETGQRPARALPYSLHTDVLANGSLHIINDGAQGAVLRIRDAGIARHYTVCAGRAITVQLDAMSEKPVTIHGPNGFFREFHSRPQIACTLRYTPQGNTLVVSLHNREKTPVTIHISEKYSGASHDLTLPSGHATQIVWPIASSDNWYDLVLTDQHKHVFMRWAGHMENGKPSRTDPHMAR
ncbi:phospholipase C, phosphocholine-specific [Acetobacter farinalis]|uniref:phospholipase C n=1 Tax=Acetobacter farinalis TaxID=1260984 RepID=A0ABT3Q9E1_9PROT|nr:phospholipase C, phosphocholine-specific [Acetobacter farinalis]MCX2561887.1 phospholipase C, phosphocholine-specific [Acetobacter farinalis]NHO30377.1 phospholipase C, phosphocholine-specific [Acetobacter farinalis]